MGELKCNILSLSVKNSSCDQIGQFIFADLSKYYKNELYSSVHDWWHINDSRMR